MLLNRLIVSILLLICLFSNYLYPQVDSLQSDRKIDSISNSILVKSPTGAVLRSLALPGWGQYYVESYWKAPLFLAGWGTLVFFIIDNHIKYVDAADEYTNYTGTNEFDKNFLFRKREYFRDYRDLNALYLLGVYIISAVDAYVGANMFDFNVDDNIALNYTINKNGNFAIKFSYKIK